MYNKSKIVYLKRHLNYLIDAIEYDTVTPIMKTCIK